MTEFGSVVPAQKSATTLPYATQLPCLLRGNLRRFIGLGRSFYAIGKISKNGWRSQFNIDMPNDWQEYIAAKPVGTHCGFTYTGPFFIRCDHGCTHGNAGHATFSPCTSESQDFQPNWVFQQCESQIQQASFVFVWAGVGEDSLDTAWGSLVEIGIARALRKPILLAHHPEAELRDFWFAVEAASAVVCAEKALDALQMLQIERSRR